jgi:hypothetical protein
MLYIKRALLVLILSVQAGFSATEIRFNASAGSELPNGALIFTLPSDKASVEVSDVRLRISPGCGTNSARVGIAFPPADGSAGFKSRELKLEFEPFRGSSGNESRAGLWAGFATAPRGAQSIFSVTGRWAGILIELKESNDGSFSVLLLQRWNINETEAASRERGLSSDSCIEEICKLSECPTQVELKIKEGAVRISFAGAVLSAVAPNVQGRLDGNEVEKSLQPEMEEVRKGDLDAAFGLANYGELPETPVLLIKSFSVKQ